MPGPVVRCTTTGDTTYSRMFCPNDDGVFWTMDSRVPGSDRCLVCQGEGMLLSAYRIMRGRY